MSAGDEMDSRVGHSNHHQCTPPPSNLQYREHHGTKPTSPELKDVQQMTIDDNSIFWDTYLKEAAKYDEELLRSWSESLSSLLLFAALFSAINTAFIIEIQKRLQPDEAKKTNLLLETIIGRLDHLDHTTITEPNSTSGWKVDTFSLWLNSIFFASLSFSLIASFGAILGQEMLAEYKTCEALRSLAEQGQIRQAKFDGLRKWRFRVLIYLLPVLIQISLALFLIGLVAFLWEMSAKVAMVVFIPVVLGSIAYMISLIIALKHEHSPFQTSVTRAIRLLCHSLSEPTPSTAPRAGATFNGVHALRLPDVVTKAIQRMVQLFPCCGAKDYSPGGPSGTAENARKERKERENRQKRKEEVKATSVTWLLGAGSIEVQRRALDAVPLLPPQVLYPLFNHTRILSRCLSLYNSNLQRYPGHVKYTPNETQIKTAIIAGTAVYHVIKSREHFDSEYGKQFTLRGDPDLFDIVGSGNMNDEYHFLLITVIHCVQSLVGVEEWDVDALLKLLQKCSASLSQPTRQPGAQPNTPPLQPSGVPNTAVYPLLPPPCFEPISWTNQRLASIALLMDSIIFCSSQSHIKHRDQPILFVCASQFEAILETLPDILEMSQSIMLTSHAAIAMSALQWYKLAYGSDNKDPTEKGLAFKGVKRRHIRSAWFAVDKSADLNRNIAMAFKLLDNDIPPATMNVYMCLMRHYEQFHVRSMSVSWKNRESWGDWWIDALKIIPGLLHFFLHVGDSNRAEVTKLALRIIAQILPDDWMSDALREQGPIAPLRYITPHDPEYGQAALSLIQSFLGTPTLHDCRATRDAAAEVLGWMMTLSQSQAPTNLPSLITNANGMYQQSASIPSFLLTVLTDQRADETLRHFLQPQFDFLLNLPNKENEGSIPEVQLEALILSLAHLHEFPNPPGLATQLREFWNKTVDNTTEDIWPDSFIDLGVVKAYQQPGSGRQVMKLGEDDKMLVEKDLVRLLWTGSAIALTWRLFVRSAENPEGLTALVFSQDALSTVLDCCEAAQSINVALLFALFEDYLDSAQLLADIPVFLREKLESTRVFLRS